MHGISKLFEVSRKASSHPMEGLRGVAVFMVFMVHYVSNVAPWTPSNIGHIAAAVHTIGSAGVDLFFVLSGYLIYGSLIANPQPFGPFIARRAQRIYPAFLVVLAVYVALSYMFPGESRIPDAPGAAALYLAQNVLLMPGMFPVEPIITVAWSLSYEMMFYLIVPLIVGWMALRRCPQQTRASVIAMATACCLLVLDGEHQRIIMFCAGMAVFELVKSGRRPPPASVAMVSVAVGLGTLLFDVSTELRRIWLFIGLTLACWHCVASASWLTRVLSWSPLRWYGNMSYSYYLIHGLTLKFTFLLVGMLVPKGVSLVAAMLAPAFLVTLVPAAMLFLLVERPLSLQQPKSSAPALDGARLSRSG